MLFVNRFSITAKDLDISPLKRAQEPDGQQPTLKIREKQGGKVVLTGTITVSRNGKSRTVPTSAKNAQGKWVANTAVYDKQ